jgi:isopentenyl phosphate kinase
MPKEDPRRMILVHGSFGHVVRACYNKCPWGYQLHANEAHIAAFQFNVSTVQIAPVVVNTKTVNIAPPSSKSVENYMSHVLTMAHTWN